ncbi:thiol-disulfide oxidoreductase DCC family protein [Metapseudomonas otitidis]|nr:thiol-disulfide oxidoreductase DCC family protein [Pseudomonas otitidis]
MMPSETQPPFIGPDDRVVLFDGVCKLCNGWARFLIRHDRRERLKLASVQSPEGQALLAWYGLPTDHFETLAYIEGQRLHVRTDAVLRVLGQLPAHWHWLRLFRVVPAPVRDWLYDRVALNRYRLFGRHPVCMLPHPDHERRFLHGER